MRLLCQTWVIGRLATSLRKLELLKLQKGLTSTDEMKPRGRTFVLESGADTMMGEFGRKRGEISKIGFSKFGKSFTCFVVIHSRRQTKKKEQCCQISKKSFTKYFPNGKISQSF